MLIIDGKVHPKIRPDGTSQKIRNGVGACKGGAITFAIADDPVTFDTFARLFRDGLGCQNALFLDGSVSSLYAPELNRDDEPRAARTDCRRRAAGCGGEEVRGRSRWGKDGNAVLSIRDACPEDAVAACEVMRRSIAELCAADHGDDPEILAQWLSNKTPENVRAWIARQDATMLVAVKSDAIVAVGMVTDAAKSC